MIDPAQTTTNNNWNEPPNITGNISRKTEKIHLTPDKSNHIFSMDIVGCTNECHPEYELRTEQKYASNHGPFTHFANFIMTNL